MISTFKQKTILIFMSVLPLCGSWQSGSGAFSHVKAILAQVLPVTAWADTRQGQKEVKPWPWAGLWPVSRLIVPCLGINRIVLAGASGSSLVFGPGHLFGTSLPGRSGKSMTAKHIAP